MRVLPTWPPVATCATSVRGFTLVELLVALMLLAFIALGLGGAMRTIAQTQERVELRADRTERQQVAIQFLRQVLGQVSGLRRPDDQVRQGESATYFMGQPQEVQWLGTMPANFGSGGRSHMRLLLQPGHQGQQLVLQYQLWNPEVAGPDWASADSYVLDSGVEALNISYQYTNRTEGQQWLPAWGWGGEETPANELPSALQMQVQTRDGSWPLLVVALHQPQVNNSALSSGGPVFGGTAR